MFFLGVEIVPRLLCALKPKKNFKSLTA